MKTPQFSDFQFLEIENFKTKEHCQLWRMDKLEFSDEDYKQITKICNEEAVYNILFKDKLEGKPYSLEKAKGFVEWGQKGWKENAYFVFVIKNSQGKIIAAIDTKSNNLDSAEIGYWASEESSGIMTNAVNAMITLDKKSGFKNLFARTLIFNTKSQNVLSRAGFKYENDFQENGKDYHKYVLSLI